MSSPILDYSYTYSITSSGYINKILNWNNTWLTNRTINCSNTVASSDPDAPYYTYTIFKINAGVFDYLYNNSQGTYSNASCIVTINVPSGSYSFQ
jgi:hypothetical protein